MSVEELNGWAAADATAESAMPHVADNGSQCIPNPSERRVFDISKLAVSPTSTIELEDAEGDNLLNDNGEPISITVYGPGSRQYLKAQAARNRGILEYVRKGGKKMKDDDQREMDAEFLAACTVSFNGFSYKGLTGCDLFKSVYLDPSIGFIAEQVNKAIGDWANFTKGSARS